MHNGNLLTQDYLKSILDYDRDTGVFRWKVDRKKVKPGDVAGSQRKDGYRMIGVNCEIYPEHRIAWLYVYGSMPKEQIDHINGDPSDNRISNLREATHQENQMNRRVRRDSTSGVKGVTKHPQGWSVSVKAYGCAHFIGYFKHIEEAAQAARDARERLHGEFCRND